MQVIKQTCFIERKVTIIAKAREDTVHGNSRNNTGVNEIQQTWALAMNDRRLHTTGN